MGGVSSEISEDTTAVLLETAYFTPMAIARTAKRLGLRTEASARFERGCDPWGIDRAAARFCELVGVPVAPGVLDVRGEVPEPFALAVPLGRVNGLLGTCLGVEEVARLIEPIGFACEPDGQVVAVTVPTNRPDVRPDPHGVADVIEEIGRTYGYSRIERRQPSWPQPGRLSAHQRERRTVRQVLRGLGALEAWTPTLMDDADHARIGLVGPAVEVANPLANDESFLRRSLLPGLLRALAYNADRRQGELRLFELGTVFSHPAAGAGRVAGRAGAGGSSSALLPAERELLGVVLGLADDDARSAVAAWGVLAATLRLRGVEVRAVDPAEPGPGLHPTRSAHLVGTGLVADHELGALGEVDPEVVAAFGLGRRRVGWLAVDLGLVDETPRVPEEARPVSRYPSSDVDLALVVDDAVPAAGVQVALARAGGDLLESVTLFDVYRGAGVAAGRRSLAYRLRFCALDRTLTDEEVGELRQACIEGARSSVGAELR